MSLIKNRKNSSTEKTEKLIGIVIAVFFCTWLPNHLFSLGKQIFANKKFLELKIIHY
jgi:hypothetical protein